jgi:hypothetical protein
LTQNQNRFIFHVEILIWYTLSPSKALEYKVGRALAPSIESVCCG